MTPPFPPNCDWFFWRAGGFTWAHIRDRNVCVCHEHEYECFRMKEDDRKLVRSVAATGWEDEEERMLRDDSIPEKTKEDFQRLGEMILEAGNNADAWRDWK